MTPEEIEVVAQRVAEIVSVRLDAQMAQTVVTIMDALKSPKSSLGANVSNDIQSWISERCRMRGESSSKELFDDFIEYAARNNLHAPSQTMFGRELSGISGVSKFKSNGIAYAGISLIHKPDRGRPSRVAA